MHTRNIICVRGVPIFYVMRPEVAVDVLAPSLAIDQLYSEEHGSLKDELNAQTSHSHALFKSDKIKMSTNLRNA